MLHLIYAIVTWTVLYLGYLNHDSDSDINGIRAHLITAARIGLDFWTVRWYANGKILHVDRAAAHILSSWTFSESEVMSRCDGTSGLTSCI